jgi:putative heme-binding domain-containing protein
MALFFRLACAGLLLALLTAPTIGEDDGRPGELEGMRMQAVPDGTVQGVAAFTRDMIEQGRHNLNAACSRCHGRDGRGGKGPDLTRGVYTRVETDRDIIDVITNGVPGTGMAGLGPVYEDFYVPVLAYMRSEAVRANRRRAAPPAGSAVRGKELFAKHLCTGCHWVSGSGGRLGPNLTKLAAAVDYVRQSVREPDSQVDGAHQKVFLLDQYGRPLPAKRLSEDTYDILVMDEKENLHSIAKQDLEMLEYLPESWMPSFVGVLSPDDIEDLTTYLMSLRKVPAK